MPERPTVPPRVRDPEALDPRTDLPPVVARMVIEIRSDGSRTIARGAVEDRLGDQTVAIEADGRTPWELARGLLGSLVALPGLVRTSVRALAPGRKRR